MRCARKTRGREIIREITMTGTPQRGRCTSKKVGSPPPAEESEEKEGGKDGRNEEAQVIEATQLTQ